MEQTIAQYPPVTIPVPGYYALYTNQQGESLHIGRVTERETIISKWGPDLYVYESPALFVRLSYGSKIVYLPQLAEV